MLDNCQAYLIAKTPAHVADLRNVTQNAGFKYCLDIASAEGDVHLGARIKFFFVHFKVADSEMLSAMTAVRSSNDDNLRFSPCVLIIHECAYEDIIKYIRLGFDDVISLPEKASIIRHRLESLLSLEQTYFETPSYFGPDRRRMELVPIRDNRRRPEGGQHIRYRIRRDSVQGVRIIQQLMMAA